MSESGGAVMYAAHETGAGRSGSAEQAVYLDPEAWARFSEAATPEQFAARWLALQARLVGAVQAAVVLGPPDQGPFAPVASWPEGLAAGEALSTATELAIAERRGVIRPAQGEGHDAVAYPMLVDDRLVGAVAVALSPRSGEALGIAMRQLQWGSGWLKMLATRSARAPGNERLAMVVELLASGLGHERLGAAATALATALALRLGCERVSIGFVRRSRVRLEALSHSATFDRRSDLVQTIAAAMEEAVDRQSTVVFPGAEDLADASRAHGSLAREHGARAVCTVPFGDSVSVAGAFTFESLDADALDGETVELCEHVAMLAGPIVEAKRREDRWLHEKAWDSLTSHVERLLGAGYPGLKLAALALTAAVVWLALADGQHRITANATLEGTVQRAVVAPLDGYVAEADVRAGDQVRAGQLIARLDNRDLLLERLKWSSQHQQHLRAYRDASANHERAQVLIFKAQMAQAEAQLELIDEQLARTRIVSPIDGLVVSGDLSQSLDAPVARGDRLFEVAPLDAYRVVLEVDDRDVARVDVGQRGRLALSGLPGEPLEMTVRKVTPVAATEEGRTFFRIEADLDELARGLRPGMEGVGKIDVEQRRLLWIWTHRFVEWARLRLWSWL